MRNVLPEASQVTRGTAASCVRAFLAFVLYLSRKVAPKRPALCSRVFNEFE